MMIFFKSICEVISIPIVLPTEPENPILKLKWKKPGRARTTLKKREDYPYHLSSFFKKSIIHKTSPCYNQIIK